MSDEMLGHIERVRRLDYTTLKIWGGHLYERYYPSYDKPDYTIVKKNLSDDEITFLENNGVTNRDK